MDTDSSLPPLLLLSAALLIFVWANVMAAARRRRPGLADLLGYSPAPGIGILRILSAALAGCSAVAVAAAFISVWSPVLRFIAVSGVTAVGLIAVHVAVLWWSSNFPAAARRLAYPRRWVSGRPRPAGSREPAGSGNANGNGAPPSADPIPEQLELTPDEILNLDQNDIVMVRSISRMDDHDVKDIMLPRLDMDAISVRFTLDQAVTAFITTRHTRLPVYGDTMDDIVGIVHMSDVLSALANAAPGTPLVGNQTSPVQVRDLMRHAEFVAENMAVDDLLHLMRTKSLQMVIVVDEYGGVEGLVTLEDVLEEIVGEIDDEFGPAVSPDTFAPADDGSWLVAASTPLEEVNRVLGAQLGDQEVNTIGGYVYAQLGRMPATGDVIANSNVAIEVVQMRGRRIQQLRLAPTASEATGPEDGRAGPAC